MLNLKQSKILHSKGGNNGEEDEEKTANIKNINSKLLRIEKKMDYLLEKDSKDFVYENDFPKFNFESNSNQNTNTNTSSSASLIQKVLNEKIWKKMHMLSSEENYNINDIIQPGVDNPQHPIGLVAYSKDCYYAFEDLLISAAQVFHKRNLHLAKYEKESNEMLISILNSMDSFLEKNLYALKISTNRNFDGFPFSGKISRNQRREVTNRLYEQLKKMENEIYENEEKGKFSFFESKGQEAKLSQSSALFDPFFQACGFYKDFPDGRMSYVSNDGCISIVTNIEDHLKVGLNIKNESVNKNENESNNNNEFSVKSLIDYFEFLNKLEKENSFCYDENLGYINTLINNLGKKNEIFSHKKKFAFLKGFFSFFNF